MKNILVLNNIIYGLIDNRFKSTNWKSLSQYLAFLCWSELWRDKSIFLSCHCMSKWIFKLEYFKWSWDLILWTERWSHDGVESVDNLGSCIHPPIRVQFNGKSVQWAWPLPFCWVTYLPETLRPRHSYYFMVNALWLLFLR